VRVSKDDTICGLAAPTARQLVRAYFDDRPVEVACDILGVSQDAARDQMRAFEAAGYVERGGLAHGAGDDWWTTTVKGNALAHASFGKPISRTTATRLLGQVIERARAYNADPARLLTVGTARFYEKPGPRPGITKPDCHQTALPHWLHGVKIRRLLDGKGRGLARRGPADGFRPASDYRRTRLAAVGTAAIVVRGGRGSWPQGRASGDSSHGFARPGCRWGWHMRAMA